MTNTTAANGKEAAYHGVPAEDDYGYAQAIKIGNTIHVSGQLSQDDKGAMIAPAALDHPDTGGDVEKREMIPAQVQARAGADFEQAQRHSRALGNLREAG